MEIYCKGTVRTTILSEIISQMFFGLRIIYLDDPISKDGISHCNILWYLYFIDIN